ncbi:MAG: hypothetical protein IKV26_01580 [Paludibacteraceae bacterium]|nr:hypothetical protein [Paludibacteraceae bacterium]
MRRIIFLLGILLATIGVSAQQTVTVQAQNYQVSDNLDLEAVAITFGESKNVEDFEYRLNDPDNRISNLDLNNDGYVDFLRVVEVEEKGTHLIVIQAVIGQDLYQDVASLIVEGTNKTSATVTIVGNRDIYGNNYVIVPRYAVRPVIFDWFWLPTYAVYRSTWYWNYYPHYYHHYTCLGYHSYHRHIHVWHNHHTRCDFHRPVDYNHHTHHVELHRTISRNDYVTHRPNQGYRAEPTPNRHVEARPISPSRPAGSLSTSTNNRVEKPATRTQPTTSTTTTTTTTRRPTTSTTTKSTTKSTTLPARPTTTTTTSTTTRKTTNTTTSTNKPTTIAPRTTTTATRSTSVAPITSNSRSTTPALRTTTSTSRATTVKPATSTSTRTTNSTARKTTTTVKTNKNTSTTRR